MSYKSIFVCLALALVSIATVAQARNAKSSRPMQKDAVLLAQILLDDQIAGAEDLKVCLAKFQRVSYGPQSGTVEQFGRPGEEGGMTLVLSGAAKDRQARVKLSVTVEEGSVTCEVVE